MQIFFHDKGTIYHDPIFAPQNWLKFRDSQIYYVWKHLSAPKIIPTIHFTSFQAN